MRVYDVVHFYEREIGAEMIGRVHAEVASCPTYQGSSGKEFTVHPDLPIDRPAGLSEFYGLCEQSNGNGSLCLALPAHDNLVVKITVTGQGERDCWLDALASTLAIAPAPLLTA